MNMKQLIETDFDIDLKISFKAPLLPASLGLSVVA